MVAGVHELESVVVLSEVGLLGLLFLLLGLGLVVALGQVVDVLVRGHGLLAIAGRLRV